jgi:iron complex outermembrane receptor protein
MDSIGHSLSCCRRYVASSFLLLVLTTAASIAAAQSLDRQVEFNIQPQPLASAIIEFSKQADLQLLASSDKLAGIKTSGVRGRFTIDQGLKALLAGTGFTYKLAGEGTVTLVAGEISDASPTPSESPETADKKNETNAPSTKLEQVTVTGTHIRGVSPSSPMIVIDREEIDRSGYTVVGDLMNSLPQNYSGGNTPQLTLSSNIPTPGNLSESGGYSPNLRGLGPGSTLTLVNGHRLGQDGFSGSVDVSLIPIDALERVEVVTDGASAAYGSDAVAGVVNFVLRKNFDGAQTNLSYGSSADGGGTEKRASQVFGKAWQGGNALLVYEHDEQEAVDVSQRDFTASVAGPTTLLPDSSRDSFLVTANQQITPGISAFFDGLYTSRKSSLLFSYPLAYGLPTVYNPTAVEQFLSNAGVAIDLAGK